MYTSIFDPVSLLSAFGALGLFLVVFAETGVFIAFFLPSDSLLFSAGILAATSTHIGLPMVLISAGMGAVLGAQCGFLIGRQGAQVLLHRNGNVRLRKAALRCSVLLAAYGQRKAIVFSRFIPVARSLFSPFAGFSGVPVRTFLLWQVLGGLLWTVTITLAGYFLGDVIPNIDQYLLPVIAAIVVISLIPAGVRHGPSAVRGSSRARWHRLEPPH